MTLSHTNCTLVLTVRGVILDPERFLYIMFIVLCRITAWFVRCFRYSELSCVFSCVSPTCGKKQSVRWCHQRNQDIWLTLFPYSHRDLNAFYSLWGPDLANYGWTSNMQDQKRRLSTISCCYSSLKKNWLCIIGLGFTATKHLGTFVCKTKHLTFDF